MQDSSIQPDLSSSALITIDVQCDTLDGQPLEIPGTSLALPNMKLILDEYRNRNLPIIHIVRIYKKDGSNVDLCRRAAVEAGAPILLEGSPGCELSHDLFDAQVNLDSELLLSGSIQPVSQHESIIYKPRWGAFYRTPLERYLQKIRRATLVFMGCNFPNCPRASIYEASERDFTIILVADAISGLDDRAIRELEAIGVTVLTTTELIQELKTITLP